MATQGSTTGNLPRSGSGVGGVVDLLVKTTVVLAAILYGFGFLVISIHQYSYGLTEMDLLRPKVLAAGLWFLCFTAVPFVLVLEGNTIKFTHMSPQRENWLRRRSTGFYFSAASCYWLAMILADSAFEFQKVVEPRGPSAGTIILAMVVSGALVLADQWERFPHWVAVVASTAFGGLLLYCGLRDMVYFHGQSVASIALWFIVVSFFATGEMESRSWTPQVGNWKQSLALCLSAVGTFATLYYPHIKPSWGGGAPTPAIIYFAKDALVLPGQSVSAQILDEVDGGFYIIGGGDKKATFIPRSEIAMVYYSDDASGPFVIKTK
jgi:hypothetical protein